MPEYQHLADAAGASGLAPTTIVLTLGCVVFAGVAFVGWWRSAYWEREHHRLTRSHEAMRQELTATRHERDRAQQDERRQRRVYDANRRYWA